MSRTLPRATRVRLRKSVSSNAFNSTNPSCDFPEYAVPFLFRRTPFAEAGAALSNWIKATCLGGDDGIKPKSDCAIDSALCQRFVNRHFMLRPRELTLLLAPVKQ